MGDTVHRKLHVDWVDLVQFGSRSGFGYPFSGDKAIATYQWLLREAPSSVSDVLCGLQYENRNCAGYHMKPTPFCAGDGVRGSRMLDWEFDLRLRFAALLLARAPSPAMKHWQARSGVRIGRSSDLPVRNRRFDNADGAVKKLAALVDRRFKVSPNSVHKRAVLVYLTLFQVRADGFSVHVQYGYPSERKQGSAWYVSLGSRPRELFVDFIDRAVAEIEAMLVPSKEVTA